MNDDRIKKTIIKYGAAILLDSMLTLLFLLINNVFSKTELVDIYRIIADAFTFSGLLTILITILIAVSNEGALDAVIWMFKRLGKALIPMANRKDETYADFKANRKKTTGYLFLLWVGLGFLVVGVVFVILFFRVY